MTRESYTPGHERMPRALWPVKPGQVIGVDLAPSQIDRATAQAAEAGLNNATAGAFREWSQSDGCLFAQS
jgi:hypothetical protein